jgi:5'-methylthioadenosine phosphorylase
MKLGILGGSGLYDIPGLEDVREVKVDTPYGRPSDHLVGGKLGAVDLIFLPRHGRGHRILPSEINHRANLFAFKELGVNQVIAFTAVGSLRADIAPRDLVLPDQYFDRTKQTHTFFGQGIAAHAPFAQPVCPRLHRILHEVLVAPAGAEGVHVHAGGTYVNIEGPAFSTRAESQSYQRSGFDVIGMTSLHEARLAREASLCYAPVALVTDYDAWHEEDEAVTVEMVVANVEANMALACRAVAAVAEAVAPETTCSCRDIMRGAVMTDPELIDPEIRRRWGI